MTMHLSAFPSLLSDSSFSSPPSSSSSLFSSICTHHHRSSPSPAAARIYLTVNSFLVTSSRRFLPRFTHFSTNYNLTSSGIEDNDADDDDLYEYHPRDDYGESESGSISEIGAGDGVLVEIKNLGNNSRRIVSTIHVAASLQTLWNILTDYERLANFIPGLSICQLLQKTDNYAQIFQVGQQNLAFGLKFNAKGLIDCYEKELQILSYGKRRDIEFKMVDGDFDIFEGKWSIEQWDKQRPEQEESITLSYVVDVKPKRWLPVGLVERMICKEIEMNLKCIRDEAHRVIHDTLHTH